MNEIEMYKKEMMDNGVDINDEQAVRNYITNDIVRGGEPTAKDLALINSCLS